MNPLEAMLKFLVNEGLIYETEEDTFKWLEWALLPKNS